MVLIHQVAIKNPRSYFLRRFIAWVCIRTELILRFLRLIGRTKEQMPLNDVEAVYSHLNVQREAENIALINAVFNGRGGIFYDVGCNYTQFSFGVKSSFGSVRCFDANPEVLRLGELHYSADNICYFNAAIIPSTQSAESAYFVINRSNTGISEVVFDSSENDVRPEDAITLECLSMSDIVAVGDGSNDLVKIDVEGLESALVADLLSNTTFNGIFCFESLTRSSRAEFTSVFSGRKFQFYIVKYDFSEYSGLMARSAYRLLKVFLSGAGSISLYRSHSIDGFDFDFIPLIFCVPSHLTGTFESSLLSMDCKF